MTQSKNGKKEKIKETLKKEFTDSQADILAEVITEAYNDLVKAHDFNELKDIVEELAEAQKRTELKLEELANAQKKTEQRMLVLIDAHTVLKAQVGGLSHTVGYRLEDESYKALPEFLRKDFAIELIRRLKRDFIEIGKEKYIEVNIYGEGKINSEKYIIVGEAKTQLKRRDIDSFIKKADLLKQFIPKNQIRVLVTYQTLPQVQKYAKEKNIKIYFSYEF